jgi:hypothetical protein
MKATTDKAADRSSVHNRLDAMCMSEEDRRHAKASMRDAELVAEIVLRAAADMRAVAHAIAGLASRLGLGPTVQ